MKRLIMLEVNAAKRLQKKYETSQQHNEESDTLRIKKCIKIWLYTIYQPLRSGRIWHKVNF